MEPKAERKGFWADFRHFFLRGLAAVLPSLLTLVLIVKGYQFINEYVGVYVNGLVIWLVANVQTLIYGGDVDQRITDLESFWQRRYLHIGGFIIAICMIYFLGMFVASFVGRWIWRMIEALLNRTPVVKQVYPLAKQVTDFFLTGKRLTFSRVVVIEYPRRGIWSLGLVTGEAPQSLQNHVGGEVLSVFMPSSPTPLTGYVVCVPRQEVVELPISIDDAFKFVISGGVLRPGDKLVDNRTVPESRPSLESKPQDPSEK